MFEILAKFFKFSGEENSKKFKLSIGIGLVEALASAMKIPAIMYILMGLIEEKSMGKYILGSLVIMIIAIVIDVVCIMRAHLCESRLQNISAIFQWDILIRIVLVRLLLLRQIQWKCLEILPQEL